jgi:hypothetical protein
MRRKLLEVPLVSVSMTPFEEWWQTIRAKGDASGNDTPTISPKEAFEAGYRSALAWEHPLYHGEGPEHEIEPGEPDPLCHWGKAIPGQRCTEPGIWRSPTIEHQTWVWCEAHKFKGDVRLTQG